MANEATVQRVLDLKKHPNADTLDLLTIKGWQVVAKSGLHHVGDLVIYVETDTCLPMREEYSFLKSTRTLEDGTEHYYIKSIKLRGQISQGLVLPLQSVTSIPQSLVEGEDVSTLLGAFHWEKPVPAQMAGNAKGNFPSFGRKTDETRIQSNPEYLEQLYGKPFYVTTKLDGTSFTAYVKDGVFGVCSRNLELERSATNSYWKLANHYGIEQKLLTDFAGKNLMIQGELVGPGIQGNPMQLQAPAVYVFNIFDVDLQNYLPLEQLKSITSQLGMKMVPVLQEGVSFEYKQDQLLAMADGFYEGTTNKREGIVVRAQDMSVSFKVISNAYLLAEK